jgi:large subunit ribosomal protein L10
VDFCGYIVAYIQNTIGGVTMNQAIIDSKKQVVAEITEKLQASQSAVVCEYRGLSVAEVTELRRKLRSENVELKVYKNTMVSRAANDLGYGELDDALTGPNAIAFGTEDAVAPARVLVEFAKKHKALVVKSGIVEGKVVSKETIKELSALPNREGMYSMVLSCLVSPIRSFACAVKAIADKENEGETPAAE